MFIGELHICLEFFFELLEQLLSEHLEQRFACDGAQSVDGIFFRSPLYVIKKLFIHEQSNTSVCEVGHQPTT